MDTIGDYYERCRQERNAAYDKWMAAIAAHDADPSYANYTAMHKAEEAVRDAGNTGD